MRICVLLLLAACTTELSPDTDTSSAESGAGTVGDTADSGNTGDSADSGDTGDTADSGGDTEIPPATCAPVGFAAGASPFNLPAALASYNPDWLPVPGTSLTAACGARSEQYHYEVTDLTGDGLADLVVFYDECGDPTVGVTHWDVYPGGPDGFDETPVAYALPAALAATRCPAASINTLITRRACFDALARAASSGQRKEPHRRARSPRAR